MFVRKRIKEREEGEKNKSLLYLCKKEERFSETMNFL